MNLLQFQMHVHDYPKESKQLDTRDQYFEENLRSSLILSTKGNHYQLKANKITENYLL